MAFKNRTEKNQRYIGSKTIVNAPTIEQKYQKRAVKEVFRCEKSQK